ncbi:MAG: type II secretion system protein [Candidatus Omnitrophica bacterium]|nr:type II secretion system protein [Candidatus Omnitrophota bacterium]
MLYKCNKAFTLIEAVLTIAILGVLIVFVFRSFVVSLRAVKLSNDITLACFSMQEKFWELEQKVKTNSILPVTDTETLSAYNKKFSWRYEFADVPSIAFKKVQGSISWDEKQDTHYSTNVTTYVPTK